MAIHAFKWSWAKPVAHLMQYHLLQWEVAKVKTLMNSNITLTMLNLYQKISKGATTKIKVKRYKSDKIVSDMQDQRSNPGHTMTLHIYNPQPMSLPNVNFLHLMVFEI